MHTHKTIHEFLNDLDNERRLQVDVLRKLIVTAEPALEEHIKWNAPSYVFDGDDRITFNLMNKQRAVMLVFHMGATRKENKDGTPIMKDDTGLIQWSSDIRGIVVFDGIEDINSKVVALGTIIKNWLAIPSSN